MRRPSRPRTPATRTLTLRKTTDLAAHATDATPEWMESLPGQRSQKSVPAQLRELHTACISRCRPDLGLMSSSRCRERMTHYSAASSLLLPQPLVADRLANQGEFALEKRRDAIHTQSVYLASVTMTPANTWNYPLKTFHRPTGAATREIVTECDLPEATRMPHDSLIVTSDGTT